LTETEYEHPTYDRVSFDPKDAHGVISPEDSYDYAKRVARELKMPANAETKHDIYKHLIGKTS
jgi:hypothetical protein